MPEPRWTWDRCSSSKGQPLEGEEHLRKAVQLAPVFAEAHYRLGFRVGQDRTYGRGGRRTATSGDASPGFGGVSSQSRLCAGSQRKCCGSPRRVSEGGRVERRQRLAQPSTCWPRLTTRWADQPTRFRQNARRFELARQQHDLELESRLESNLERFEREGAAVRVRQ